jgi:triosephosphate isomerase (TIM)
MKYTYVANWKMNLTYNQSIAFCTTYKHELESLHKHTSGIILCPSFIALAPIAELFKNSTITIGAQNCSEHQNGSFTGEISAQSLAQVGITHCFVGHSERRILFNETTDVIIKKIELLLRYNITPIICIGETKEHFNKKATFTVLTEQLRTIIDVFLHHENKNIMIAYEPIWSIGSGIIPEETYLQEIFMWLSKLLLSQLPGKEIQLFYGGSVNEKNIHQLKNISYIDGFLIGGASTDFTKFAAIVTEQL